MDGKQFDSLARQISSRRTALGGLLAGLLLPLEAAARGKNAKQHKGKGKSKERDKGKGKGKGKNQQRRTNAQEEPCWRAGACVPKKGANVSRCDLDGYSPNTTLNCTGCNASRANLRGAQLQGANFTKANLSGACLVDADFTDATLANNTNLANAIFCNTTMPDGSVNNSGCGSGTPCCPTCDVGRLCLTGCCNTAAGTCGACPAGSTCGGGIPGLPGICGCTPGTCASLGKTCGDWPDGCGGTVSCGNCASGQCCTGNGTCGSCLVFVTSSEHKGNLGGLVGADAICQGQAEDANLPGDYMAWLSAGAASPSTRFVQATVPYRLVTGETVAASWTALTTVLPLQHAIDTTAAGAVLEPTGVWTATDPNGTKAIESGDCAAWTVGESVGSGPTQYGGTAFATSSWTAEPDTYCDMALALYCFQQR